MTLDALQVTPNDVPPRLRPRPTVLVSGRLPYVLSGSLAVVAAAAALFSFLFPSLLTGAPVATGNMRGTCLAILVVGLPVLVTAMRSTAHGSARSLVVWLGTLAYLLYQAVLFCFAIPLNNLFLVYVAYLGLCVWSLLTNPVFVQDLAIWLPLLTIAAIASWNRKPWGLLLTGAMLAMFVLESLGIATDQWFGSRAAPLSPSASMSAVPAFVLVAVITAIPLAWFCRYLDEDGRTTVGDTEPL